MKKFTIVLMFTILAMMVVFGISYFIQVWVTLEWDPTIWTKRERIQLLGMPIIAFIGAVFVGAIVLSNDDDDYDNDSGYGYL